MLRLYRTALGLVAALAFSAAAHAQANFQVKDAAATTISKCSQVVGGVHHECQISEGINSSGLPVKARLADDGQPLNPPTAPTLANQAAANSKLDAIATSEAATAASAASIDAKASTISGKLDTLHNDLAAPTPGGSNTIGDVGSASFSVNCSVLTLPGTGGTFASGDLVANSATAGSVTPLNCTLARYSGGPISITAAQILSSTTGLTGASFRIHAYTASPTVTNGNDGVFLSTASGHFCSIDVTLDLAFSNGALGRGAPVGTSSCARVLSGGQAIYLLVEARGAYAWAAGQTLTISPEGYN